MSATPNAGSRGGTSDALDGDQVSIAFEPFCAEFYASVKGDGMAKCSMQKFSLTPCPAFTQCKKTLVRMCGDTGQPVGGCHRAALLPSKRDQSGRSYTRSRQQKLQEQRHLVLRSAVLTHGHTFSSCLHPIQLHVNRSTDHDLFAARHHLKYGFIPTCTMRKYYLMIFFSIF